MTKEVLVGLGSPKMKEGSVVEWTEEVLKTNFAGDISLEIRERAPDSKPTDTREIEINPSGDIAFRKVIKR